MNICDQCKGTILNEAWVITGGQLLCSHCAQLLDAEHQFDPDDDYACRFGNDHANAEDIDP